MSIFKNYLIDINYLIIGELDAPLKEEEKRGGPLAPLHNRYDLMDFIKDHLFLC